MIRRILCPTDFEASSRDSVAYALRLAKENSAELIVFHATSFPGLDQYACAMDDYFLWQQLACAFKPDRLLGDAERRVKNFVRARFAGEIDGVVWRIKVALGDAAEEIVRAAFQEEADLVVMGRCKKGKLERLLRRSVPETVVSKVSCPVLSIDSTQFVSRSEGWRLPGFRALWEHS